MGMDRPNSPGGVRRSGTFLRRVKGVVGLVSELQRELSGFFRTLPAPLNPAPDALASSVIEFRTPTVFPRLVNLRSSFRRHSRHVLLRLNFINPVSSTVLRCLLRLLSRICRDGFMPLYSLDP